MLFCLVLGSNAHSTAERPNLAGEIQELRDAHQLALDAVRDEIRALKTAFAQLLHHCNTLDQPRIASHGPDTASSPGHTHSPASQHHQRSLADNNNNSKPDQHAIRIEQPQAAIHFAPEQTSIKASAHKQLHLDGSLRIQHDLAVDGKLLTDGTFLNLGVPLTADLPVKQGTLVSLVPGGGVEPGFGLHMSPDVASMPAAHELSTVWVGGNATVTLVQTKAGTVSAVYYDMDASSPEAGVSVGGGASLQHVSVAGLAEATVGGVVQRSVVVCYVDSSSADSGLCALGVWRSGSGLSMGAGLSIRSGTRYMGGAVSGVGGSSSRAVVVYNVQETPGVPGTAGMEAQVLMVQGGSLVEVGSSVPLVPGATSHHSLVWVSSQSLVLAYRADQRLSGHCRELYFEVGAPNVLKGRPTILDIAPVNADPTHVRLVRLSDTRAIVAYRLASDLRRVYARSIDTSTPLTSVGEAALVDAGTTVSESAVSHAVGLASGSSTRFVVSFADATGRMMVRDGGLYGTALSLGATTLAHTDSGAQGMTASVSGVGLAGSMRVVCVVQASGVGSSSVREGMLYGGPTVLGFAKSDAGAGESVYVVLDGGVSGFTGLVAGAWYYGRPDGSVSVDGRAGGLIAGKAMSSTVLKSMVSADGPGNAGSIGELRREVEAGKLREASLVSRVGVLEGHVADLRGRMPVVEASTLDLTPRMAVVENVTAVAHTNITTLQSFSGGGVRAWSGYDTNNVQAGSWAKLQLTGTRYDTTQGEITVQADQVLINKAGWYDVAFRYRRQYCMHHYSQLYAGGVQKHYSWERSYDSYRNSDFDVSWHHWQEPMHLNAGDVIHLELYCSGATSTWYSSIGGAESNSITIRVLAVDDM